MRTNGDLSTTVYRRYAHQIRRLSLFLFSYADALQLNATGQFPHNTLPSTPQEGTVNTQIKRRRRNIDRYYLLTLELPRLNGQNDQFIIFVSWIFWQMYFQRFKWFFVKCVNKSSCTLLRHKVSYFSFFLPLKNILHFNFASSFSVNFYFNNINTLDMVNDTHTRCILLK